MAGPTYDAFVSYRRADGGAAAQWLRRELEGFRLPKRLAARYGEPKLRVYIDTAYERGTSDFYDTNIRPALLGARHLIVVATPMAVARPGGAEDWIQREIDDFTGGPNGRNVFVVRAAGPDASPVPGDLAARFPNIQVVDLRGAGRLWWLNPLRAARLADAKSALVAPLLEIAPEDMSALRQEEERRQQTRLGAAAGVTIGVLAIVSTLAIVAVRSRWNAERALESSMFATGRTVLSVADGLGDDAQLAELRARILGESCELIDRLRAEAVRDPGVAELVTCAVERARAHEQQSEPGAARAVLEKAVGEGAARVERQPSIHDATALLDGRWRLADLLARQKDAAGADAELRRIVDDARRSSERLEPTQAFSRATREAHAELGRRADADGRVPDAAAEYAAAAEVGADDAAAPAESLRRIIELRERAAEAYARSGNADAAVGQVRAALASLDGMATADRSATWVHVERAACLGMLASAEWVQGHRDAAIARKSEALAQLHAVDAADGEWAERVRDIRGTLEPIGR
jgi:hypothetical protein